MCQVQNTDGSSRGSASEVGNPWRFQGRRFDPETGWLYFRARFLDPAAGRWVSRDPLGIWGDVGQIGNAYSFCGNDPVNGVDPSGLGGPPPAPTPEFFDALANGTALMAKVLKEAIGKAALNMAVTDAQLAAALRTLASLEAASANYAAQAALARAGTATVISTLTKTGLSRFGSLVSLLKLGVLTELPLMPGTPPLPPDPPRPAPDDERHRLIAVFIQNGKMVGIRGYVSMSGGAWTFVNTFADAAGANRPPTNSNYHHTEVWFAHDALVDLYRGDAPYDTVVLLGSNLACDTCTNVLNNLRDEFAANTHPLNLIYLPGDEHGNLPFYPAGGKQVGKIYAWTAQVANYNANKTLTTGGGIFNLPVPLLSWTRYNSAGIWWAPKSDCR